MIIIDSDDEDTDGEGTENIMSKGGARQPRTRAKILRPDLNEICSKPTIFKCVWSKGVEYEAVYNPRTRLLTWNGHDFKNLNEWINVNKRQTGVSITEFRNQKGRKNVWEVCYILNSKNEWIYCDTLTKGCGIIN
jgi:hypothetical protein